MIQLQAYTIRLLMANDSLDFFNMVEANRTRLEAFFPGTVARTRTIQDTVTYMHEVMDKIQQKIYLPHIMIEEASGKFVAFVDLKNIDWHLPRAELGCFVDTSLAQKGVAKKALSAVTEYYFTQYGFNKFFLRTHKTNTHAVHLAESCGFMLEGVLRNDFKNGNGALMDMQYYGLIRP